MKRCTGRNSSTAGSALTKLAPISCAELLVHVHIADSDRQPPGLGGYNLTGFLRHLRVSGYDGDCSIECRWLDFSRTNRREPQVRPRGGAGGRMVMVVEAGRPRTVQ